ncbi:MAG: hypothetical protein N3A69_12620 [Leptospiraceae bacterium]|nr:hypothetical protein [Leptospiraceae bacterium]
METVVLAPLLKSLPDYMLLILALVLGWYVIKKLEQKIEKLEHKIEALERKLEAIAHEMVTREQHYQDVSGWRSEILRMEDKFERQITRVLDKLMEKGGGSK